MAILTDEEVAARLHAEAGEHGEHEAAPLMPVPRITSTIGISPKVLAPVIALLTLLGTFIKDGHIDGTEGSAIISGIVGIVAAYFLPPGQVK